jgi:putative ABC transport system permease protein
MILRYAFKTAISGLRTHKSRSFLTILGIVIGITAIIVVMSLGNGAQNLILSEVQSIGPRVIAVSPGRQPTGPSAFLSTMTDSLKNKDLTALENKGNVPHLDSIMPVVFGSEPASYGSNTYRPTIFGVTPLFSQIYNVYPSQGRGFTDDEVKSYANVAVIGSKVKDQLFANDDPIGQKIKINSKSFEVIGVLTTSGQSSFLDFDDAVVVPYTTAQQYIFGIKYFNRLVIEANSEAAVPQTVQDVKITLRNSHNITDPTKDDFFVETQAQAMEIVGTITSVLTLFLAAVAAISLLVGGIGIMNIMLVSVTERTKEIGLRKALGATERDILTQFIMEAVILTATGGVIGILLGAGLSFMIAFVLTKILALGWLFSFPIAGAAWGLGVSAFVGLAFGIYPALRAARLNPVDALRYE